MITPVTCVCDFEQEINVPEGRANDLEWECRVCDRRNTWLGPDGPEVIILPTPPEGAVHITDVDSAIASTTNDG